MLDLKTLARPFRYRVVSDAEGLPVIPGRLGQIESHDGQALAVLQHATPDLRLAVGRAGGSGAGRSGTRRPGRSYRSEALPQAAALIQARRRDTLTSRSPAREVPGPRTELLSGVYGEQKNRIQNPGLQSIVSGL